MQKTKYAGFVAAAALVSNQAAAADTDVSANTGALQINYNTIPLSPGLSAPGPLSKAFLSPASSSGNFFSNGNIGIQYKEGCDLLFARNCKAERKRFEIRTPGSSAGYTIFSYEAFNETVGNTILNKQIEVPLVGGANANAGWDEKLKGWLINGDKYFTPNRFVTIKLGASAGTIRAGGDFHYQYGYDLKGGTYTLGSYTLPGRTINVSPFSAPSETINWPNTDLSFLGSTINIPAGQTVTPPINFPGGSLQIPTLVTPSLSVTIPAKQREWQQTYAGSFPSYFGEIRMAGGFDAIVNPHFRINFNPYAQADLRAFAGGGINLIASTAGLNDSTSNADGYLGRPFIPKKGFAFSLGFYETKTLYDFGWREEKQYSNIYAAEANNYLAGYTGKLNGFVAGLGQRIGYPLPQLKAPTITGNEILKELGIQSPLGTATAVQAGVGGHITKDVTFSLGARVPLHPVYDRQYTLLVTKTF